MIQVTVLAFNKKKKSYIVTLHSSKINTYHNKHLLIGFIDEFSLQFQVFENWGKLDNEPITRYLLGLCSSMMLNLSEISVICLHQICKDIKN